MCSQIYRAETDLAKKDVLREIGGGGRKKKENTYISSTKNKKAQKFSSLYIVGRLNLAILRRNCTVHLKSKLNVFYERSQKYQQFFTEK